MNKLTTADFVRLVLTVHLPVAVEGFGNTLVTGRALPLIVPVTSYLAFIKNTHPAVPAYKININSSFLSFFWQHHLHGLVGSSFSRQLDSSDSSPQSSSPSQRHVFSTHFLLSHWYSLGSHRLEAPVYRRIILVLYCTCIRPGFRTNT